MTEWLLAPVDPARVHDVGFLLSWHARLMVLGWAVLVPLGILIARYFKITPRQDWPNELDNRFWWRSHLVLQGLGLALTLVALLFILNAPRHADQSGPHLLFGWSIVAIGLFQLLGGLLRGTKGGPTAPAPDGSPRGDHFDMTPRRIAFEVLHKGAGYAALALSVAAILTGLWQANAPNGFFIALVLWWSALCVCAVMLQRRGLVADTYQAIWGDDPALPGNRRKRPVGLGVTRRSRRTG